MHRVSDIYTRLASNPLAIVLYTLCLVQLISIVTESELDPIKLLFDILTDLIKKSDLPKVIKTILHVLQKFLAWQLKIKKTFDIFVLFLLPLLFKFTISDLLLAIFFASIFSSSTTIPVPFTIFLIHLWLFYSLTPSENSKFLFFFIFITCIVIFYLASKENVNQTAYKHKDTINHTQLHLIIDNNRKHLENLY